MFLCQILTMDEQDAMVECRNLQCHSDTKEIFLIALGILQVIEEI